MRDSSLALNYGIPRKIKFETDGCYDTSDRVDYLEHVQIVTNIEYTLRGALQIHLTAPSGTRVKILGKRKLDNSSEGFKDWKFMSVATWGENPRGIWIMDVVDEVIFYIIYKLFTLLLQFYIL